VSRTAKAMKEDIAAMERRQQRMFAGSEWVENSLRYEGEMSELGRSVADLLGDLFFGIYHMNTTSLHKVEWDNNQSIAVTVDTELATFDSDGLTRLVVLCHDRMIRCSIQGLAPRYVRLMFHQRQRRDGGSRWERHPTLEAAAKQIRAYYTD